MKYTQEKLNEILAAHKLWLEGIGGARANLQGAYLQGANLQGAYLQGAYLQGAYLQGADLQGAYLQGAYLQGADLQGAYLQGANLQGAYLQGANLQGADLQGAYLQGANLQGAYLQGASGIPATAAAILIMCPQSGAFVGWKKCIAGVIVKLLVPESAARSSATSRKCRAEFVEVLEVFGAEFGVSSYDRSTEYRVRQTVRCDKWEPDRWQECAGGIHFFITREEAEDYN